MNQRKCRHISQTIARHAHRLSPEQRNAFLQKALQQWDGAANAADLPTIDTSEADKRREEQEAKERQGSKPADKARKGRGATGNIRLVLKPPKEGNDKPLSPTTRIIERLDGRQMLYQTSADGKLAVREIGRYRTPVYQEQRIDQKRPAPADDREKQMEKSRKLETLIAAARKNPAALQPQTLAALNAHLSKTGQPPVVVPSQVRRWGSMPSIGDIARNSQIAAANVTASPVQQTSATVFNQAALKTARPAAGMTGHQIAAANVGCDPSTPGLERMSLQEMKDAANAQQLAAVNAIRATQGLPPL